MFLFVDLDRYTKCRYYNGSLSVLLVTRRSSSCVKTLSSSLYLQLVLLFQPGFINSLKFSSSGQFLVAGVGQEHRWTFFFFTLVAIETGSLEVEVFPSFPSCRVSKPVHMQRSNRPLDVSVEPSDSCPPPPPPPRPLPPQSLPLLAVWCCDVMVS